MGTSRMRRRIGGFRQFVLLVKVVVRIGLLDHLRTTRWAKGVCSAVRNETD